MKKTYQLAALLWLVVASLSSSGQTQVDVRTQTKNVDFSGANFTIPAKSGSSLPATCNLGEMFFNTSAAPGLNLYTCAPANTWTVLTGASASTSGTVSSGNSGQFAYYAANGATVQGHTLVAGDIPALNYQSPLRFTGNGANTASSTGTVTANNCAKWDSNGNIVDAGAPCSSGGGGTGGSGGITAPSATTIGNVPQYNDTTGATLSTGLGVVTTIGTPGSDSNIPTEKSVRTALSAAANPAFSNLSGGTNSSAALVIGSGASLAATGTGAIAATSVPASGVTGTLATSVLPVVPVANGGTGTTTPSLVAGSNVTVSGTWPNQTISATASPAGATIPATTNLLSGDGTGNGANSGIAANQVVTLSGTQTLTNKSISAGQITGLASSATTDTTNAANISTGTLPAARLPNPSATTPGGVQSVAAVSHQWVNSISTLGVPSLSQPAASDITGLAASATTDTTNASNVTSGTLPAAVLPVVPVVNGGTGTATPSLLAGSNITVSGSWPNQTVSAVASGATIPATTNLISGDGAGNGANSGIAANQVVTLNGTQTLTNKSISAGQISGLSPSATIDTTNAANIASGTLSAARLPNPSATTLGGVQSVTSVTHQWVNSISTSGVPSLSQPAASDIANLAPSATIDTTSASNITKGTLPASVLPVVPVANGGTGTATPSLAGGSNVTVSGAWPNQTISTSSDTATPSALVAWRKALAKASSQVVRIKIFGDSISRCISGISCASGTGPSDPNSLWVNNLRTAISNAGYPVYSTGMLTVISGLTNIVDGTSWTLSGTAYTVSTLLGPQETTGSTVTSLVKMPPGAIATMSAKTGTTLNIYCATYTDSTSGLNVAIDGTSVGTACGATSTTATPVMQSFTVTSGSHTVVLTSNSTGNAYLYGAEWVNATYGVAVDNYSIGGIQASGFAGHFDFSDLQTGDALTIIALGTNEAINGVATSTYTANMTTIASHETARGSSVLLFSEPPCNNLSCSTYQPSIIPAAQALAQTSGYGYVSAYTQWPSFAIASGWSMYSDTNLHPNDNGQLLLTSLIDSTVLPGTQGPNSSTMLNGSLNITESSTNGGYTPMINLYSQSTTAGNDTNMSFANPSHAWRIGFEKANSDFYLYDSTASRYDALWDTNGSPTFTANANYGTIYVANTSTGNAAQANIVYTGTGRKFMAGVGNASDTTYGCANKWCIYDLTGSANRASIDSTGIYTINQGVRLPPQTFASWTACGSNYNGTLVRVSDSTTTTVGAVISGGGTSTVTAMCDGTNYRVLAPF